VRWQAGWLAEEADVRLVAPTHSVAHAYVITACRAASHASACSSPVACACSVQAYVFVRPVAPAPGLAPCPIALLLCMCRADAHAVVWGGGGAAARAGLVKAVTGRAEAACSPARLLAAIRSKLARLQGAAHIAHTVFSAIRSRQACLVKCAMALVGVRHMHMHMCLYSAAWVYRHGPSGAMLFALRVPRAHVIAHSIYPMRSVAGRHARCECLGVGGPCTAPTHVCVVA
jgi:hypothetical protein